MHIGIQTALNKCMQVYSWRSTKGCAGIQLVLNKRLQNEKIQTAPEPVHSPVLVAPLRLVRLVGAAGGTGVAVLGGA